MSTIKIGNAIIDSEDILTIDDRIIKFGIPLPKKDRGSFLKNFFSGTDYEYIELPCFVIKIPNPQQNQDLTPTRVSSIDGHPCTSSGIDYSTNINDLPSGTTLVQQPTMSRVPTYLYNYYTIYNDPKFLELCLKREVTKDLEKIGFQRDLFGNGWRNSNYFQSNMLLDTDVRNSDDVYIKYVLGGTRG